MTDWNWFFSSVAQSFAAVVGILSGFITSRLVTNQAQFARRKARGVELLQESERLHGEAARRQFDWYNKWENVAAYERAENTLAFNVNATPVELYQKAIFSPFFPIEKVIGELERRINARKENMVAGDRYTADTTPTLRPKLDAEREHINQVLASCKHHARSVAQHIAELESQPEMSPVIRAATYLTLMLFFCGVVYPLSFLPMPTGLAPILSVSAFAKILFSLRGALLAISASIFAGACVAALRINASLRYSPVDTEELRRYTSAEGYSVYFRTLRANEDHLGRLLFPDIEG